MKQTILCETNKNLGKQNPKTNQNSLGKYDSWNKSRKTNYRLAINSWIHETNLSNLGKPWNQRNLSNWGNSITSETNLSCKMQIMIPQNKVIQHTKVKMNSWKKLNEPWKTINPWNKPIQHGQKMIPWNKPNQRWKTINQTSIFQHRQISKSQNKPTLFLTNLQLLQLKIVNELMTN